MPKMENWDQRIKPGLCLTLKLGDVVEVNGAVKIQIQTFRGKQMRVKFLSDREAYKITRNKRKEKDAKD